MLVFLTIPAVLAGASPACQQLQQTDTVKAAKTISLEDAIKIALSENASVKVADLEIQKSGYARKGQYAALFPQIDGSASFQRTIKKQVMYMDGDGFNFGSMIGETLSEYLLPLYAQHPGLKPPTPSPDPEPESGNDGITVGRWNTWSAGVSANMPLVNAQLWKSLQISDKDVELAVEKARSSRLETVNQVKNAYFLCLLTRAAADVYKQVYENALANLTQIQRKYNAQKASELDLTRAKTTLANAIPNVYDAESSVYLSLWQLKAVMGVDLDMDINVEGSLMDYSEHMLYDIAATEEYGLDNNSTMKQMAIQAEQLANAIKVQQYSNIPSLGLGFSYMFNAMANDFKFSEYQWSPYSYVGISLSIPIFAGGRRASAIKQAKVQATELDVQRINTEKQLKIAIRQYLNSMDTAMKSFASAQSAVETAQKAYNIASRSYDVGRSTLTDLNDAQLALTQSQLAVVQAVYTFVTSKSDLENILGADFIDEDGNVQLNNTYKK